MKIKSPNSGQQSLYPQKKRVKEYFIAYVF